VKILVYSPIHLVLLLVLMGVFGNGKL